MVVVVEEVVERLTPDRMAVGVLHPGGHDEQVARVLVEQFVRLGVQRVRRRIPDDLVDADHLAPVAAQRVAQPHQEDRVAAHTGRIDRFSTDL